MEVVTPPISLSPPAHKHTNDNYCIEVPQKKDFVEDQTLTDLTQSVNLNVVCHVPCATGPLQRKDISPFQLQKRIKSVKPVCCVDHCLCVQHVNSVLHVVENPPVGGRLQLFWQVWLSLGANPRIVSILKEGYSLPFKIRPPCQPLLRPGQKQTSEGIFAGSDTKTSRRKGHGPFFPSVLQLVISGSKTQQQVEAHPRPQSTEPVPSVSLLQNGNPRDHQTLPSKRGVGHIAGLQRCLLSCSHKSKVAEIPEVSSQWPNLSIHCPPFWPVHGSVGVHQGHQGGQIDGTVPKYPNPPVPRRLVSEGSLSGNVDLCRRLGWIVNMTKSELCPQQVFNFVGYRFNLSQGLVKPTQERWSILSQKINLLLGRQTCSVRQFMSLIGLLTATEKQVLSGRLHMRPLQWHLKRHWHVPEALEKIIPIPWSLHTRLKWWLDPEKVLKGQPLHPLQHALQLFTDASNEGWGAHFGDCTARGLLSRSEGELHINLLELKAVLLALKQFEQLCWNQTILVCTDNTTVVAYINKGGGMRSGSLSGLLSRLLLWCNQRQIVL